MQCLGLLCLIIGLVHSCLLGFGVVHLPFSWHLPLVLNSVYIVGCCLCDKVGTPRLPTVTRDASRLKTYTGIPLQQELQAIGQLVVTSPWQPSASRLVQVKLTKPTRQEVDASCEAPSVETRPAPVGPADVVSVSEVRDGSWKDLEDPVSKCFNLRDMRWGQNLNLLKSLQLEREQDGTSICSLNMEPKVEKVNWKWRKHFSHAENLVLYLWAQGLCDNTIQRPGWRDQLFWHLVEGQRAANPASPNSCSFLCKLKHLFKSLCLTQELHFGGHDWHRNTFLLWDVNVCTIYYMLFAIYYTLDTDPIYYILYTIYYILYTIYCILYTVYCILYTIYYILYTIYYILYTILYTIYYILYTTEYILHTTCYILHTTYYILYTIWLYI